MALLAGGFAAPAHASETCVASVYWEGFDRPLADGRRHRPDEVLAAHKSLPFGTRVSVTNLATGRMADVLIADRGPFFRGRCLDLSRGAARALGIIDLAHVRLDLVIPNASNPPLSSATSQARTRQGAQSEPGDHP